LNKYTSLVIDRVKCIFLIKQRVIGRLIGNTCTPFLLKIAKFFKILNQKMKLLFWFPWKVSIICLNPISTSII